MTDSVIEHAENEILRIRVAVTAESAKIQGLGSPKPHSESMMKLEMKIEGWIRDLETIKLRLQRQDIAADKLLSPGSPRALTPAHRKKIGRTKAVSKRLQDEIAELIRAILDLRGAMGGGAAAKKAAAKELRQMIGDLVDEAENVGRAVQGVNPNLPTRPTMPGAGVAAHAPDLLVFGLSVLVAMRASMKRRRERGDDE